MFFQACVTLAAQVTALSQCPWRVALPMTKPPFSTVVRVASERRVRLSASDTNAEPVPSAAVKIEALATSVVILTDELPMSPKAAIVRWLPEALIELVAVLVMEPRAVCRRTQPEPAPPFDDVDDT
uniref:Unannotated protein n=1 Tax=freshwater metagenome TaxID=449393 RepID=A0A6J5Z9J0_9ZZZZ